ncbi:hypothetical protein EVAR_101186_1 [Eumeta japonica]|uniref:Uncharacterized protein n=1 Tax=Eumeta variegata TaxID=151549 RepID=A0A4C1SHP3_EUMVA|nr:hypothetical protein EVAR_101186_1 [Eumeta japonica]
MESCLPEFSYVNNKPRWLLHENYAAVHVTQAATADERTSRGVSAYVFVRFRSSSSRPVRALLRVVHTYTLSERSAEQHGGGGVLGLIFVTEFLDSVAALKARVKSYAIAYI